MNYKYFLVFAFGLLLAMALSSNTLQDSKAAPDAVSATPSAAKYTYRTSWITPKDPRDAAIRIAKEANYNATIGYSLKEIVNLQTVINTSKKDVTISEESIVLVFEKKL
ncbi:hypothetical protein [Dyadobacter sp. CY326]|uniref:hypothetical protein n=1 Tax=Dyadobacter sp. CY326 TaxID=2907300 RepID=UPI001F1E37E9|nr:hypothetical protein [Dyadobacter sp. CY326]MCE7065278.1 hypothetical protein [Dyadobacter sp. CY326]